MSTTTTFRQLAPLLPIYAKENLVPFLAGEPGIGKSAVIKNLATKMHTKVFVLSVNQLGTREDLTGARSIKDEETGTYRQVFFPHAIIQDAIDYAKSHPKETPLLFLDEINRTSPDVTSAILALITERRVGTTNLPDNIRIIAAGNDKGNVNNLDEASITRMAIFHIKPDVEDFVAAQPDLNFYIKQLVTAHPDLLVSTKTADDEEQDDDDDDDDFDGDDEDDTKLLATLDDADGMQQMTVPRTLTYTSRFLNGVGLDGVSLPDNLDDIYSPIEPEKSSLYLALEGQLGDTPACQELWDNITKSIDQLNQQSQTNSKANTVVNEFPKPTKKVLNAIINIKSDDDFDNYIQTIDTKQKFTNFANTFFTVIQPKTLQKLASEEVINQYFKYLGQNMDDLPAKWQEDLLKALQNHIVPASIISYIKQHADDDKLSHAFKQIIDIFDN